MIRLLFLLFLLSCSNELVNNSSIQWVDNVIVQIDRANDELYIQVETANDLDVEMIDSVKVNIEYAGGVGLDYNDNFLLYDDGSNGDIIPDNGIFTLISQVNSVSIPDEQAEIINVNFPSSFRLDETEMGVIPFSLTIRGKKYLVTVSLFENSNEHILAEHINIDNTALEIQINKKDLYIDDTNTEFCDRVPNTYEDIFYPISFDWPDATSSGLNNYFTYESGFSVSSMSDCGSTGSSIFKFILNDLDMNESVSQEKTIIIFGCGDGICEEEYEDNMSCSEDCIDE